MRWSVSCNDSVVHARMRDTKVCTHNVHPEWLGKTQKCTVRGKSILLCMSYVGPREGMAHSKESFGDMNNIVVSSGWEWNDPKCHSAVVDLGVWKWQLEWSAPLDFFSFLSFSAVRKSVNLLLLLSTSKIERKYPQKKSSNVIVYIFALRLSWHEAESVAEIVGISVVATQGRRGLAEPHASRKRLQNLGFTVTPHTTASAFTSLLGVCVLCLHRHHTFCQLQWRILQYNHREFLTHLLHLFVQADMVRRWQTVLFNPYGYVPWTISKNKVGTPCHPT